MAGMAAEYGMAALESRVRALMQLLREEMASAAGIAGELEPEILRAATALRRPCVSKWREGWRFRHP